MSYKRGDLKITGRGNSTIYDGRSNGEWKPVPAGVVYLSHSCDEWIIGGLKELNKLIADLLAIAVRLEWEAREALAAEEENENGPVEDVAE